MSEVQVPRHEHARQGREIDFAALFTGMPTAYLVMTPDLVIAEANEAYLRLLNRSREELIGQPVFEAFPPAAHALDGQDRIPLRQSFERARDTGRVDVMPLYEYDVLDPASGQMVQRYWSLISAPILDAQGHTQWIMQRVEDVSELVAARGADDKPSKRGWQARFVAVESDLFTRTQELRVAVQAEAEATRRLAALTEAALRLVQVETVPDLAEEVLTAGLSALGADGGAIAVRDDSRGVIRLTLTDSLAQKPSSATPSCR